MSFLAAYHDPALAVDTSLTAAALSSEEVARLVQGTSLMAALRTIPRRLGADASGEELAEDKKRARRVEHVFEQCWLAWQKKKLLKRLNTEELQRQAAVLNWHDWSAEHRVYLLNRMRYIVTWCNKTEQTDKGVLWTKQAIVRLENEQRWLEYALR